ncbi:Chromatin-remodelling complex RSC SWI/SNF subunit Rsc7/Swp82 [Penicillium odoratum]|uniref:Chromatin-remodelling complex RSC SWI/SNF subunit Rsc7/Swp82 n=1 Tax=Penicillium odoratum TaxID=1167516 RepID=UPI0025473E5B|nr:Chromatin-remodelling complex RSC SWI/SNF subunit Rsc7/Swp82 [Penicillium odoratum]KAJ5760574.1 Chromatin-remodelling complex RSC SWI/SNF subunit Rsc7/Swp82 [Penicillium odoratum]
MPRKLRAAAQAAAKSMRDAPQNPDASDDEMLDAPPSVPSSPMPDYDDSPEDHDMQPAGSDAEPEPAPAPEVEVETPAEGTPAEETPAKGTPAESKDDEGMSVAKPAAEDTPQIAGADDTPTFTGGRQSAIPRKRRIGRPPKNRPPDWDAPDGPDTPLRVTTPVKRRRGRPAASGGRWARNRGPSHLTQVPVDKEGNMMDVINDEVAVPPDPKGSTKVDENGHLADGREYRVRTFTILNRDDRLYMLSTEPARCIGFRDSYLFFQKHKMLYKIIIDDDAKRDLIERDLIPHSYKGRAIGVVTARSVFREFGAKIVVGGKKVIDDYYEDAARERGDVEGELAVPEDKLPGPGEPYNRNQYVAWHGASSVYHTGAPSVPLAGGKPVDSKKRRVPVTDDNWMLEHARAASTFNSKIVEIRRGTMGGVYDVHTNTMHYPQITQPTHVRYERVPPSEAGSTAELMTDLSSLTIASKPSVNQSLTNAPNDQSAEEPSSSSLKPSNSDIQQDSTEQSSIFPPVSKSLSDRHVIQDIIYETPSHSNMGLPGPDGDMHTLTSNGLVSLGGPLHPEFMSPEIIAMLPEECREGLLEHAAHEIEWKSRWSTEATDGARGKPTKSYAWYP